MARFRIVNPSNIKKEVKYRLLTQPSTPWSRNRGIVLVELKNNGKQALLSNEKGGDNALYEMKYYGKTWGLQEVI